MNPFSTGTLLLSFIVQFQKCSVKPQQSQTVFQTTRPFFPINSESFWIYDKRDAENGTVGVDSVRVSEIYSLNHETAYKLSTGVSYLLRGDSVYQIQRQRSGFAFPTLQFYPVKDTITFRIVIGGDAFGTRTACLLNDSIKVNNNYYKNCIKFEDFNGNYFIIAPGIGFIEKKIGPVIYKLLNFKI